MVRRELREFLDPTPAMLADQWQSLLARSVVPPGTRQVHFVPCEVVLCLGASLLVDHSRFGSSTASKAGYPVQHLASLFKRPPTSVLAKMANLDGSRSNGGYHEIEVSARLMSDSALLQDVYLRIMRAARSAGIDSVRLPDFLQLEGGGALWLSGQEELVESEIEASLEDALVKWSAERDDVPIKTTQRLLTSTVRVGQHRFAERVLANHQHRCVFCGLSGTIGGKRRPRMLTASHIKPWRDSTNKERLDHRNGFTACPTHDVAFDTGLITVDGDLRVHYASGVEADFAKHGPLRNALGRPPLADRLVMPDSAERPDVRYLDWHLSRIFVEY
ncbi:putative restriction endonuclease [Rhodococcus maanshanensis]|uniref:Putative restriction endonuclease n=2 Tax=Rhodococcus maanshanensis TaxID=183556 RepID=A0A1H7PM22_9NOCA|nr:putative restriction endonuclease [Rhodococcus maanshanensis]